MNPTPARPLAPGPPPMIACDKELRQLVPGMEFGTEDGRRPFKPDDQIRPASIDLRLDRVFWVPRRRRVRRAIDLRRPVASNQDIERYFERRAFRHGEGVALNPGRLLLGRVYETFRVPPGWAGKIEGRSTFARLGLAVHCTGDFINPGWRGHMPLQLVNHGRSPIILTPYMDVCQLVLIRLTAECERPYGAEGLDSKYVDDEGAPSRYWEDQRLKKLQEACGRASLPDRFRDVIGKALGGADRATIDRFHHFLDRLPSGDFTNARDVLLRFARRDSVRGKVEAGVYEVFRWLPFALVPTSIGSLLKQPIDAWHYALWAATLALSVPGFYYRFMADPPTRRLKRDEVEAYFRENE